MSRRTGYLSCIENVPPLIFRFQFNPEVLSDKKSYKYEAAPSFGLWRFDQTQAGAVSGVLGGLKGLLKDTKEIAALLINTKPLEPKEGDPRQITLEFKLDATRPGPLDGNDHFGGSILPDIAMLRSFMTPSFDIFDLIKMISDRDVGCFNRPPQCSVSYGHVSMTGVMTDLDIKVVEFFDDGSPMRAEVSATVKEQSYAVSPIIDTIARHAYVFRGYVREGFFIDVVDSQLPSFITNSIPFLQR